MKLKLLTIVINIYLSFLVLFTAALMLSSNYFYWFVIFHVMLYSGVLITYLVYETERSQSNNSKRNFEKRENETSAEHS
jgi:Ca2+/Na+ antiporter